MLVPGNGVVIIGMSERTSRQAITQVAAQLFAEGAADKVVVAGMPKLRAAMHLDTVFTFADRDVVTIYPDIIDNMQTFTLLPSDGDPGVDVIEETKPFIEVVAAALGLATLRVVETGGTAYDYERQQWDSGNNLVAVEPGRGVRLRPQYPHQFALAQGRYRGHHHRRSRTRPRPRWRALHDLPNHPRPIDW